MPSQSVAGLVTPVGDVPLILIEADNPGGSLFVAGTMNWEANFSVSAPILGGIITPASSLFVSDDAQCFPTIYECVADPEPNVSCIDVCEPTEIPAPPSIDLDGVIIPVGQLVEPCPEADIVPCCLLCGPTTPEGNVDGDIGCLYEFTGAVVASPTLDHPIYAKLTGSSNTGWGAMYGLPGDGVGSVRVGLGADASGADSIAAGAGAQATNEDASAFGSIANASGLYSTALGHSAIASGIDSTAVGGTAQATGDNGAFAGGWAAMADGEHAISLGYQARDEVKSGISIGYIAKVQIGDDGIAVSAENGIAIGCLARVGIDQSDVLSSFGSKSGIAIGAAATCLAWFGTAFGVAAIVKDGDGLDSMALGHGAEIGTDGDGDIAIGAGAKTDNTRDFGIALGYSAEVANDFSLAVGYFALTNALNQMMFGSKDTSGFYKEMRFNGGGAASPARCPNVVFGNAALATNATDGFPYLPSCAGAPTGTPTAYTGTVPIIIDTTNNKIMVRIGGAWKGVVVA